MTSRANPDARQFSCSWLPAGQVSSLCHMGKSILTPQLTVGLEPPKSGGAQALSFQILVTLRASGPTHNYPYSPARKAGHFIQTNDNGLYPLLRV